MNAEDDSEESDEDTNQEIIAYLLSRLEATTHSNIITPKNEDDARGIWTAAKTHFASSQSANRARVFNNFLYLPFNEQQIHRFVTTVKIHLNKLMEVGIELPTDILAYLVLFKFPPSLKSIQSQIMHGVHSITANYVLNHLIKHKNETWATKEESKADISLLNVNILRCTNGVHSETVRNHFQEQCWAEFPHLRPSHQKRKENRKNERERKDYAHFFSFFGGTDFAGPLNRSSIILDSGCSVHLLNSKSLFRVLEEEDGSESIKTGKPGAGLKILGKGIALIKLGQVNLELKDAYYVPEATINLFSFGKLPNLCR